MKWEALIQSYLAMLPRLREREDFDALGEVQVEIQRLRALQFLEAEKEAA